VKRSWLRDIIRNYSAWTTAANGAGLYKDEEPSNPPREWNDAYFKLMADCVPGIATETVDELALSPINSLPDEPFFDIVTQFLRSLDDVFFNDRGLHEVEAVRIRSVLARRLMTSRGWRQLSGSRSTSIEVHIAPAIAAFFFNDYKRLQPAKCYLFPKGIDRIDSFLPILLTLIENGVSFFVAHVALNLFEVSAKRTHLQFIIAAARKWLMTYPDLSAFWIDHDMGRRVCSCLTAILNLDPRLFSAHQMLRNDVDWVLAELVRLGVPEAHHLEGALRRL
jgi:hypothetical protein